jgi:hypothetical protein
VIIWRLVLEEPLLGPVVLSRSPIPAVYQFPEVLAGGEMLLEVIDIEGESRLTIRTIDIACDFSVVSHSLPAD